MDQLLKAGALKRKNEINKVEVVRIVKLSRLGGVVVSVVAGSNTAKAMDFKGDKDPQHTCFGWEVNPKVASREILRHAKDLLSPTGMNRLNSHFLRPLSYSLQRCLC
jgi:hypothetical protein